MKIQGAIVKEQGQTFAIVIVKPHIISDHGEADTAQRSFAAIFPGMPVILMAQNSGGVPTYYGRPDIVKFLANIDFRRIPWKEYTIN